jgi:hypothetical protein
MKQSREFLLPFTSVVYFGVGTYVTGSGQSGAIYHLIPQQYLSRCEINNHIFRRLKIDAYWNIQNNPLSIYDFSLQNYAFVSLKILIVINFKNIILWFQSPGECLCPFGMAGPTCSQCQKAPGTAPQNHIRVIDLKKNHFATQILILERWFFFREWIPVA